MTYKHETDDKMLTQSSTSNIRPRGAVFRRLIMGTVLCGCLSAHAASYYVAPSGSDTGPGTQAQPWRTLQHAADAVAAGDTVLVAPGTYAEQVKFSRSGTPDHRIVFKNAMAQHPVIEGQGLAVGQWGALVSFTNVAYIRFEGFEVRNSSAYNVFIGGESHHLELVGLDVHDGPSSGIWVEGPLNRPAMSLIYGNKVHNHKAGGITIWAQSGGYYRIEANQVYENLGSGNYDGIQVGGGNGGGHHVVVKSNIVHDNGSTDAGEDPVDVGGHGLNHHYVVEDNYLYNNTGSLKLHSGVPVEGSYTPGVSGFHIARFNVVVGQGFVAYDFPNPLVLYNNTFINCGQCVMFYGQDTSANQCLGDSTYTGGDTGRMNWKNNLFFQDADSSSYALLTTGPGAATIDVTYRCVRFQNNMYKFAGGQKIIWGNPAIIYGPPITAAVFSTFQKSTAPSYPDSGSLVTTASWNQMFAGSSDYHLAGGSPAIDKGAALTKALNAGSNATTLVVDRASYFQDGYCVSGECLNTPDTIVIGSGAPVAIVSINDVTNTITLAQPRTWTAGAGVSLPFNGAAPDIGALEHRRTPN